MYGRILCSARVRAWASCFYRVECRAAGLGGGVAAGLGVGSFFSVALFPWRVACTRVYSSSWTRWSVGILRCVRKGGPVLSCRTMVWPRVLDEGQGRGRTQGPDAPQKRTPVWRRRRR